MGTSHQGLTPGSEMSPEGRSDIAKIMRDSLKEFGYGVDVDYVLGEVNRLLDTDERPLGGPSMFIADWLKKAGWKVNI